MRFSDALFLGLSTFFCGIAINCFLCIVFRFFAKKEINDCRFSIGCICLSCFVVLIATLLLFFKPESVVNVFRGDVFYFLILFAAGFVFSAFWKILIMPVLFCFVLLTVYSNWVVKSFFDYSSGLVSVTVSKDSIEAGASTVAVQDCDEYIILAEVCQLPVKLLLPANRFYCSFFVVSKTKFYNDNLNLFFDYEGLDKFSVKLHIPEPLQKFVRLYNSWLLRKIDYVPIEIPKLKQYPALFSIHVNQSLDDCSILLVRDL